MMIEEFEKRTGFYPTLIQYEAIERAYMDFDGDKDAFCKAYKKNANGMAERIQREVNMATLKAQRDQADGIRRRWCKSSRPHRGGRSWVYPSAPGESTAAPFHIGTLKTEQEPDAPLLVCTDKNWSAKLNFCHRSPRIPYRRKIERCGNGSATIWVRFFWAFTVVQNNKFPLFCTPDINVVGFYLFFL